MNTELTYFYRDAANYKAHRTIILEGSLLFSDIVPYLEEREYFIPADVGLDDLQEELRGFPAEDDHVWHSILKEDFKYVLRPATEEITAAELLQRFKQVGAGGWRVLEAVKRLKIPP